MEFAKRCALTIFTILIPMFAFSQGLDDRINAWFDPYATAWENLVFTSIPIGGGLSVPLVLIVLVFGATFFTLYFRFVNLRLFGLALKVVRGKYDELEGTRKPLIPSVFTVDGDIPDTIKIEHHQGEVNHFQALSSAVSGTVGLGNIAGVAVAIAVGGPGATFWMIVAGLLGMSSKFVECTLGVKYRDIDEKGTVYGGPMYYLKKGLKERGMGGFGKVLAVVFAILCVGASFGGGNAFQSNQAAAQVMSSLNITAGYAGALIGLFFAIITGVVIIGGIKRIGAVAEKLVPAMAILYVIGSLIVVFVNISFVDEAFMQIINGAFAPAAIGGGILGVMIQGFRRAAFSNEAGAGSAAIAHSAVNTAYPASEGIVALLEPFIDTVVICTLTALVIIFYNSGDYFTYGNIVNNSVVMNATGEQLGGVNLTSTAFESVIPHFSYILSVAVILFAFSTILSWSYYGLNAWKYLFGRSMASDISFKIIYLLFVIIGAAVTLDSVIKFSDAMILALVFPNMIGLLLLFPKVREELNRYLNAIKNYKSTTAR
ncbi:MAG TPA: alanine/glycine:cation symporter family protein [Saprospiraceae bacterium]|nr:alanine/glycine:cation symporter family protein [Saprospiraceae bacterium]